MNTSPSGDSMRRDIVVVGASAGGVVALRDLVSRLPPRFPAAVLRHTCDANAPRACPICRPTSVTTAASTPHSAATHSGV